MAALLDGPRLFTIDFESTELVEHAPDQFSRLFDHARDL